MGNKEEVMPTFGKRSRERLETCHGNLQTVFNRVIEIIDCSVVEGYRDEETQNRYFNEGKSKVKYPNGKHNRNPSDGIDVCPYINGSLSWDARHCLFFAGIVIGISEMMGIKLRWGGDWDMDGEPVTDQEFQDLVHFELVN